MIKRVEEILTRGEIEISNENKILWKKYPIARLKKGNNYLNPEIEILADDALNDLSKSKLEIFLKNWVDAYIKEVLGDLLNLNKESVDNKYIRALMFQLFENNGVIKRELVNEIVKSIETEERKKIWELGIKIGRYHIFLPKMLKPKAVEFRISLWRVFHGLSHKSEIPKSGLNFLISAKLEKNFLLLCGFEKFNEFFVRINQQTNQEELIVNEIAPRVHNSGHWTLDGADVSQFTQHIKAIIGLEISEPQLIFITEMYNIIGDDIYHWSNIKSTENKKIYIYGKDGPRKGRKMGHVNFISRN